MMMPRIASLAFVTLVALTPAAMAQQQAPQPPANSAPAAQQPSTAPTIQTVSVVDIKELPAESQKEVQAVVEKRSADDLTKLRTSVKTFPEARDALQKKGMNEQDVIAASLSENGALTLITKKAS
ncbi:hypothetical protein [Ochrobactrum sp. C6C9]